MFQLSGFYCEPVVFTFVVSSELPHGFSLRVRSCCDLSMLSLQNFFLYLVWKSTKSSFVHDQQRCLWVFLAQGPEAWDIDDPKSNMRKKM